MAEKLTVRQGRLLTGLGGLTKYFKKIFKFGALYNSKVVDSIVNPTNLNQWRVPNSSLNILDSNYYKDKTSEFNYIALWSPNGQYFLTMENSKIFLKKIENGLDVVLSSYNTSVAGAYKQHVIWHSSSNYFAISGNMNFSPKIQLFKIVSDQITLMTAVPITEVGNIDSISFNADMLIATHSTSPYAIIYDLISDALVKRATQNLNPGITQAFEQRWNATGTHLVMSFNGQLKVYKYNGTTFTNLAAPSVVGYGIKMAWNENWLVIVTNGTSDKISLYELVDDVLTKRTGISTINGIAVGCCWNDATHLVVAHSEGKRISTYLLQGSSLIKQSDIHQRLTSYPIACSYNGQHLIITQSYTKNNLAIFTIANGNELTLVNTDNLTEIPFSNIIYSSKTDEDNFVVSSFTNLITKIHYNTITKRFEKIDFDNIDSLVFEGNPIQSLGQGVTNLSRCDMRGRKGNYLLCIFSSNLVNPFKVVKITNNSLSIVHESNITPIISINGENIIFCNFNAPRLQLYRMVGDTLTLIANANVDLTAYTMTIAIHDDGQTVAVNAGGSNKISIYKIIGDTLIFQSSTTSSLDGNDMGSMIWKGNYLICSQAYNYANLYVFEKIGETYIFRKKSSITPNTGSIKNLKLDSEGFIWGISGNEKPLIKMKFVELDWSIHKCTVLETLEYSNLNICEFDISSHGILAFGDQKYPIIHFDFTKGNDLGYLMEKYIGTDFNQFKDIDSQFWNIPGTDETKLSMRGAGSYDSFFLNFRTGLNLFSTLKSLYDSSNRRTYIFTKHATLDYGIVTQISVTDNYGASIRLVRDCSEAELSIADGTSMEDYICNDGTKMPTIKYGNYVWTKYNLDDTKLNNQQLIDNTWNTTLPAMIAPNGDTNLI